MRKHWIFLGLFSLFASLVACEEDEQPSAVNPNTELIDRLQAEVPDTLFLEALAEVDWLAEFSADEGTIYIPDDAAFREFMSDHGADSIPMLKDILGKTLFNQILSSHFIENQLAFEQVVPSYVRTMAKNQAGDAIHAYLWRQGSEMKINGEPVLFHQSNLEVDRFTVHRINRILSPATLRTLITANNQRLSVFSQALSHAQAFGVILNQPEEMFSLFLPEDAAIDAFLIDHNEISIEELVQAIGQNKFEELLSGHVTPGYYLHAGMSNATYPNLIPNQNLELRLEPEGLIIYNAFGYSARLLQTDIIALNGNLSIIDKVLRVP